MLLLVVALVVCFVTRGSSQMVSQAQDDMYTHMIDTTTGELYEVVGFNTYAFEVPDRYDTLPTQTQAAAIPSLQSGTSLEQLPQINESPSHITNPEINVNADTSDLHVNDEVLPTQTSAARIPLQQSSVSSDSLPLIRESAFVQTNAPIVVAPAL
jgi:hypothetical protein